MRTTADERIARLRMLPIFAHASTPELARIDALVDEIEVEEGEVLLREGDPGAESFVVVSGTASVSIAGVEVATLGPGDFFGEMALLDGGPRAATVTAYTAMSLLVVAGEDFAALLDEPGVAQFMLREIVRRFRARVDATATGGNAE